MTALLYDQVFRCARSLTHPHPPTYICHRLFLVNGCLKTFVNTVISDKSIAQGAATTLYACLEPSLANPDLRGSYLSDCAVAAPSKAGQDADHTLRKALWDVTAAQVAAAEVKLK